MLGSAAAAAEAPSIVIASGDRDFSDDLRRLSRCGLPTVCVYGPQSTPDYVALAGVAFPWSAVGDLALAKRQGDPWSPHALLRPLRPLRAPAERPSPRSKSACRDWASSKGCRRGDRCRFSHAGRGVESSGGADGSGGGEASAWAPSSPIALAEAAPPGGAGRKVSCSSPPSTMLTPSSVMLAGARRGALPASSVTDSGLRAAAIWAAAAPLAPPADASPPDAGLLQGGRSEAPDDGDDSSAISLSEVLSDVEGGGAVLAPRRLAVSVEEVCSSTGGEWDGDRSRVPAAASSMPSPWGGPGASGAAPAALWTLPPVRLQSRPEERL